MVWCREDDEPFDSYVKRMKQEGAWAGARL